MSSTATPTSTPTTSPTLATGKAMLLRSFWRTVGPYHWHSLVEEILGIEFFALWMGLSKLGVISAWINSNLKQDPLAHSINVSGSTTVITSKSLLPTLLSCIEHAPEKFPKDLKIYLVDGGPDSEHTSLSEVIEDESEPTVEDGPDFQSVLCYIYTSGTTGNPKAAIIKHYRYVCVH